MKRITKTTLAAALAASAALTAHASGTNGGGRAAARDDDRVCSVETLNGAYGLSVTGTRPAPPPLSGTPSYVPGTIEAVIGVGRQAFDGNGTFTQVSNDKGALSGIVVPNRAGSGTYTVNDDCTGTTTLHFPGLPFAIVSDIVIVGRGREVLGIIAAPQAVEISSVAKRQD